MSYDTSLYQMLSPCTEIGPYKFDLLTLNAMFQAIATTTHYNNESTAGADASVEALKLYHMKLTSAYSRLLASLDPRPSLMT